MNAFGEPPAISELFLLTPIAEIEELAVYRVDDSVPPAIRARAAAVAYAATQDMPSFKVAYDGSSTPERLRMYVVLSSALAVAMLTVATTKRCWRLRWTSQREACLVSKFADQTERPRIGQIWIANSHRRLGIATRLLDIACACEGITRADVGWQLPFTLDGVCFARATAGEEWYGDGDFSDLFELLGDRATCPDP